jgi:hypothetical protein
MTCYRKAMAYAAIVRKGYNTASQYSPVGTFRQGYLLLVCPAREVRGYP